MNLNLDFIQQLSPKKVGISLLFLALCFALGFGIYYLFFSAGTETVVTDQNLIDSGSLPSTGDSGLTGTTGTGLPSTADTTPTQTSQPDSIAQGGQTATLPIIEQTATNLQSSNGLTFNFYDPDDNKFYTYSAETNNTLPLSDQSFFEVQQVDWNDDSTQAILTYPDGSKILYDFSTDKQLTLSANITDADFSNSNSIAYKYISDNTDDNWLAVTDPTNDTITLIEPLGENADRVQVAWSPNNTVVALYAKPIGLNTSEVFFIGLQDENFLSLEVDGSNFKGLWAPSGYKLLYQVVNDANDFKPNLWIVDAYGDNIGRHKMDLSLRTWVDKCVFASDAVLYCAVPQSLPQGAGLYPDLIQDQINDYIYKIDLTNNTRKLIAQPIVDGADQVNIEKMFISTNQQWLFFQEKNTGQFFKMQLK